jgi:hypothetical protein
MKRIILALIASVISLFVVRADLNAQQAGAPCTRTVTGGK